DIEDRHVIEAFLGGHIIPASALPRLGHHLLLAQAIEPLRSGLRIAQDGALHQLRMQAASHALGVAFIPALRVIQRGLANRREIAGVLFLGRLGCYHALLPSLGYTVRSAQIISAMSAAARAAPSVSTGRYFVGRPI